MMPSRGRFNQEVKKVVQEDTIHVRFRVRFEDVGGGECSSVIVVPERALDEGGFIRTLTAGDQAHAKHEFHAMAQMAMYQFEDGELEITEVRGPITITWKQEVESLTAGMVIYRDGGGNFHLLAHKGQNAKKLLEAANRFCTRWVRLDI